MAKLSPQEFTEKHNRRLKESIPDIEKGIQRVTEAPGKKAAAKADKMLAGITKSVKDGTWARRVSGVTLEDWKDKILTKGVPRIAGGIDAAAPKVEAFAAQLLPHIDKVNAEVQKMPDLTLNDSIARMTKFVKGMAEFSKK